MRSLFLHLEGQLSLSGGQFLLHNGSFQSTLSLLAVTFGARLSLRRTRRLARARAVQPSNRQRQSRAQQHRSAWQPLTHTHTIIPRAVHAHAFLFVVKWLACVTRQ